MGKRLKKIREDRLYEGSYETFAEFLKEMDISEGTASKIIAVQSFYGDKHNINRKKLAEAGWSKLYSLLKLTDEDDSSKKVEAIVEKGITLWRSDIEDEIREHVTGCVNHQWGERIVLRKCIHCSKKIRDDES